MFIIPFTVLGASPFSRRVIENSRRAALVTPANGYPVQKPCQWFLIFCPVSLTYFVVIPCPFALFSRRKGLSSGFQKRRKKARKGSRPGYREFDKPFFPQDGDNLQCPLSV
jgi:hypothetical protein